MISDEDELCVLETCCSIRWRVKLLGVDLDLDLDLAPAKFFFFFSKMWCHANLIIDKHRFVYNFMDLYVMIKFSLLTTKPVS